MTKTILLSVFIMLVFFGCSDVKEIEVSKDTFEGVWPFTVDSGRIGCDQGQIYFKSGTETYGINGLAKKEYGEPDKIWMGNPNIPGTKIPISDIISKGLELCE